MTKKVIMKTFKSYLNERRNAKGLLMRELASMLNIDAALLSKFESGKRKPTKEQVEALYTVLGGSKKQWMTLWLSEKIRYEIAGEEFGLDALILAEEVVRYEAKPSKKQITHPSYAPLLKEIDKLRKKLNSFRKYDSYRVAQALELEYTYESNRIEGNTLTLRETDLIVNEGLTISGKTMREHLEAINHKDAIGFIKELMTKKERINQSLVLSIHNLILRGVDTKSAGVYRDVQVMIKGSKHFPPSPFKVRELMDDFFAWYNQNQHSLHPVLLAAEAHERLVTIHPFVDGNGRTARLLMNLILLQHGFVIANIKGDSKSRMAYYTCLEKAQVENDKADFINFIIAAETDALNRYISIIEQ